MFALNKQVYKYTVLAFSNKISMVSLVLYVLNTGYGFVLPCMHFVHLALLDYSMSDYL